jgi:glucose-6-phosphate 1-epimerase
VTGLEKVPFLNKVPAPKPTEAANAPIAFDGELDRVYSAANTPVIGIASGGKNVLELRREEGLTDVVVWNPGSEKAAGMGDFSPKDGYKNMVCVEAGAVDSWVKLEGGDGWEGGQRVKVVG